MSDLIKIMHCGCQYDVNGTGYSMPSQEFLGDGSDGDCTICYDAETFGNVFIEAKEYNFCNLTICDGVKLRFCGNGMPIIRVKENFENYGCIILRNPLINACSIRDVDGYLFHTYCNDYYNSVMEIYNCVTLEALKSYQAPGGGGSGGFGAGGAGGSFYCAACSGADCGTYVGGTGGASTYTNAAGGGGGGAGNANGGNGGNASGDGIGGVGGTWGSDCAGGGGGGFGYCKGGDGGKAQSSSSGNSNSSGGAGGNSIIGKGGNGGYGKYPGKGGCSYYGDGGDTGAFCCYGYGNPRGGCSMFGNGGNGKNQYCSRGTSGGSSVYGVGGNSGYSHYGSDWYTWTGSGMDAGASGGGGYVCKGYAWNGVYPLFLAADTILNEGEIFGRGGNNGRNTDTHGAEIRFFYNNYTNCGCITCAKGDSGGYDGFFKLYKLTN